MSLASKYASFGMSKFGALPFSTVALVAAEDEAEASHTHAVAAPRTLTNGISLLRLSVPARLLIVATRAGFRALPKQR